MSNRRPFFSVIIACHNAQAYVRQAVESAFLQDFDDFEVIAVDDGSSDQSHSVLRELARSDSRLRIVRRQESGGPGPARNSAAEVARGEWLAILDADDVWLGNKLRYQYSVITAAGGGIVLVGSDCYHIDAGGRRVSRYSYPTSDVVLKRHLLANKAFPPHSSIAYCAKAFRALGGFNGRFHRAQDYDLWLRMSLHGQYKAINVPLVEYRINPDGVTRRPSREGFGSRVYGTAAIVAHLLRVHGHPDPSASQNERGWREFLEHTAAHLAASNAESLERFKAGLRATIQASNSRRQTFVGLAEAGLRRPDYVARLIYHRVFGDPLPRRCYRSWVLTGRD